MKEYKEYNQPKQNQLAYRFRTYSTFFQRMLAALPTQTIPPNGGSARPLAALTTRDSDDPTIALLDSWSMVGDVLTFYTERMANEGFLRTAIEFDSITRLAHLIGYQPHPGVAASSSLAFTVEAVDTSGVVTLPAGIQVQSVPRAGQMPQMFETSTLLEPRPEWNELQPDRGSKIIKQSVNPETTTLRLAGTNSGLQPGDKLLILDKHRQEDQSQWYVVTIQKIEPKIAQRETIVIWEKPLGENPHGHLPNTGVDQLQLLAFRQQAALFGYDAPRWQDMPDSLKREKSDFKSGLYKYDTSQDSTTWQPIAFPRPFLQFQALAAHSRGQTHYLFVGTAGEGVFRSIDGGQTWQACNTGLSNPMINSLYLDKDVLYAGTTNGTLFRSFDDGENWEQFTTGSIVEKVVNEQDVTIKMTLVADGLPKLAIHAIAADGPTINTTTIYAGTDDGVYQSKDKGATWSRAGTIPLSGVRALLVKGDKIWAGTFQGLKEAKIQRENLLTWLNVSSLTKPTHALAANENTIWAVTDDGIYESSDDGETWTLITVQIPDNQMASALAVSNGGLLAVTPSIHKMVTQWPGFRIDAEKKQIDLDTVYQQILPDSWVLLINGQKAMAYGVGKVESVEGHDFTQLTTLTRLTLTSGEGLNQFGGNHLRTTKVLLQSEWLPLYEESQPNTTPVQGDKIILDHVVPALERGRSLILTGQTTSCSPPNSAIDTQKMASEYCMIKEMTDDEQRSTIILRKPLEHCYERATVMIQANVVQATQGETVANEVLGSGNGRQSNQRFRLRRSPLTYISAPTERGIASTLTVRVNDIEWQEVEAFNHANERSQCYIVRQDSTGQSYVIFGDGQKGARLPTGVENVVATYRYGSGLAGNVEANTLITLRTSPLGLLDVTNPLPASGGTNPQPLVEIRQDAPLTIMTMDRIVSLSDYEMFATTFAGIGKAQATLLWTGSGHLIYLTVADTKGDPVSNDSLLYRELKQGIEQRRNSLLQDMEISSNESASFELAFKLSATLTYDSRYQPDQIERTVKKVLLDTFSFQKRAFAQDVTASDVIAVIQAQAGVIAVNLTALYLSQSQDASFNYILKANPARWDHEQGKAVPAELLLIKDEASITLHMENGS